MSTPEFKRLATATIVVSKETAAKGQLETAIALWFHYGDPVSIHTLAAAAQGILQGMAGKKHPFPHMRTWIKQYPERIQKILREPQNFFKHAWTDPKDVKTYQPHIGALIITDAALLHQDLYGLTPFIRAFTIRIAFEWEGFCRPDELSKKVTQNIRIDDLVSLDRPAFFQTVLARLAAVGVS